MWKSSCYLIFCLEIYLVFIIKIAEVSSDDWNLKKKVHETALLTNILMIEIQKKKSTWNCVIDKHSFIWGFILFYWPVLNFFLIHKKSLFKQFIYSRIYINIAFLLVVKYI